MSFNFFIFSVYEFIVFPCKYLPMKCGFKFLTYISQNILANVLFLEQQQQKATTKIKIFDFENVIACLQINSG